MPQVVGGKMLNKNNYSGKDSVGVLFYVASSVYFVTKSASLQLSTRTGFAQLAMPGPWACGGAENRH